MRQTIPGFGLTGLLVLSGLQIGSTFEVRSEAQPVGLEERAEVRLRSVRMRIDSVDRRVTDVCADLGVEQLKVSLRGKELDSAVVRHLERDHRPAIHAVLIDTSSSMVGRLAYARDAAVQYIERLRPGLDRAMIATFDDSVILVQSHTDQQEVLREALGRVRLGGSTALIDGLYFILGELAGNRERGVVLLLTDGVDTTSFHDWDDVRARAEPGTDTTMFVIGLGLPELQAGRTATRKILQKFASRTNGKFFDVPTAGRLENVYLRIREMLDSEAVLMFTDPDPTAEFGRVNVTSRNPECKVRVFRQNEPAGKTASVISGQVPELPVRLPMLPAESTWRHYFEGQDNPVTSECGAQQLPPEERWFLEATANGIQGCQLDVVMEHGPLYADDTFNWYRKYEAQIQLQTRYFTFPVGSPEQLPHDPAELLDDLGAFARSVSLNQPRPDSSKRRVRNRTSHYRDYPGLSHGVTLLETRPRLAAGLYMYPAYRALVMQRLQAEAEREIQFLEGRLRLVAPDRTAAELRAIALLSETGQAIMSRAKTPTGLDLQTHLAAWLGDVSAHDLFVGWERLRIDRMFEGTQAALQPEPFLDEWHALRKVFQLPSYARVLTLLTPVQEIASGRIGFWRVILPRTSWMIPRARGYKRHPDWSQLPLDLIPDHPGGYWVVRRLMKQDPALATHLRDRHYRVAELRYELIGKPNLWTPTKAFRHARVIVELKAGVSKRFTIATELAVDGYPEHPLLNPLVFSSEGDPWLADWLVEREGG